MAEPITINLQFDKDRLVSASILKKIFFNYQSKFVVTDIDINEDTATLKNSEKSFSIRYKQKLIEFNLGCVVFWLNLSMNVGFVVVYDFETLTPEIARAISKYCVGGPEQAPRELKEYLAKVALEQD